MNWSIVHLEMVNILLAVRLFQVQWSGRRGLIRCDNEAVALADMDLQYAHIRGLDNGVADLLSRWTGSPNDFSKLLSQVQEPVRVPVNVKLLDIDPEL